MDAHAEQEERRSRDMWECMRVLAAIDVSPFSKTRVKPDKILKFPWDGEAKKQDQKPVSREDDVKALENLMQRIR